MATSPDSAHVLEGGLNRQALTVPETAEALRISTDKVYALIRANQLPHKKLGRRLIVPMRALEDWLNAPSHKGES